MVPISFLSDLCCMFHISWYSTYLMQKFCDLGLGRFKVIQV